MNKETHFFFQIKDVLGGKELLSHLINIIKRVN